MNYSSRKRPRSCEDEACDLMPISKRINDLHIRSGFPEIDSSVASSESVTQGHNRSDKNSTNVVMMDLCKQSHQKENFHCAYSPELSVAENPYYYHVNEVLFEAHLQRLRRLTRVAS